MTDNGTAAETAEWRRERKGGKGQVNRGCLHKREGRVYTQEEGGYGGER